MANYNGVSVVDYLTSQGQASDYTTRAKLATQYGISNYTGTAAQNTQLLNTLRGGATVPTATPTATVPTQTTPTTQNQAVPTTATGGSDALIQALISKGYNPTDAQNAANGPRAAELAREYLGTGSSGNAGVSSMSSLFNTTPVDLTGTYKTLYDTSGISKLQEQFSAKTSAYNAAVAKINDNPYLSEATRVGRIQKLTTNYNNDTANVQNQITSLKSDVETQMGLVTKQYDINSDQAQQALSTYNSLLSSGSLGSVDANTIASIASATGLSSSMIQSAIDAQKKKDVQTQVISYDDGTNQGYAVINSTTGEIINKQVVANSKPKTATATETKESETIANQKSAIGDIQRGATLRDIINHYAISGSGLSVEDLYRLYNSYSPYGTAQEDLEDVKAGKFVA